MKLLLLTTDINIVGGVENVISKLCNYFVDKYNYNIEIISLYGDKNKNTHFNINNKIKIAYANLQPIEVKSKLGEFIKDIRLKKQIQQLIKDREFDIIMTFHVFISIAVILNRLNIKGKIVVTEHNDYYHGIGRIGILKRKLLYSKADKVVVLTENNKNIYDKFLNNVEVINNPRPFISTKTSQQEHNRVISAGRLEFEKGFDRLIEVFNDADIKQNNWKLDIYGDGSEKENIINKIKKYELEDKIRILPFTDKIKEEFLKADIYVLPSRTEAFGMVLLEAMECGLPCISFDISGPREIIKNGEDGFIIEENNNELFREKLKLLMNNKDIRKLYSNNAKKNVTRFDIKNIAPKWDYLFRKIKT